MAESLVPIPSTWAGLPLLFTSHILQEQIFALLVRCRLLLNECQGIRVEMGKKWKTTHTARAAALQRRERSQKEERLRLWEAQRFADKTYTEDVGPFLSYQKSSQYTGL